jgi:hypothetical protein
MEKLINWSELSRYITRGDRNGIRSRKIPKKHLDSLDKLFTEDIPAWWKKHKEEINPE